MTISRNAMSLRLLGAASTRRQFLGRGTAALASLGISARLASGMAVTSRIIPNTAAARRTTHDAWLPEVPEAAQFRALALVAMDAAKQAGAEFADIRIGAQRECAGASAHIALGYGIRARVNGALGFTHGNVMTREAVARVARGAVAGARMEAAVNARMGTAIAESFPPIPVVAGEWRVPVEIDPFTVPIDDFYRVQELFNAPVRGLGLFVNANGGLRWTQETRVFASTDGSLVTQSFTRGGPDIGVSAALPTGLSMGLPVTRPDGESMGFEVMLRTDFAERIMAVAEETIRWRELPLRSFNDVGRFPVVLDGAAFAAIVGRTLSVALDGDRLSGHEADASGRSFLTPFAPHPTQPPPEFSPLLRVTSHRALPSSTAAQWDDDGVASTPCTLVEQGTVVDFHTTRDTASMFDSWYQQRHRPARLHGRSVAPTPTSLPMANGGDVQVAPASSAASELELCRGITHGFLVKEANVDPAPGLTTGLFSSGFVVEVVNGKPVAQVNNLQMAFVTNAVLKLGLTALGDASTLRTTLVNVPKGMPWEYMEYPVTAPAAHCKEVDVLRGDLSR